MCGIFGYKGNKETAAHLVIEGLKKLEYRGYDSWGIAVPQEQRFFIYKKVGKIGEVNLNGVSFPKATIAMGHCRWATHGGITEDNAHPHTNEDRSIALVHNGIIENCQELRDELTKKGHRFTSETDTETAVHLIEEYLSVPSANMEEAFLQAIRRLKGRYAILAMHHGERTLFAARRGSSLIVGVNDQTGECYVASDISPFIADTKKVLYIDDDQMVVIGETVRFFDVATGKPVAKRLIEIEWEHEEVDKCGYPHYMIKEIMEQKETILRAINQDPADIQHIADLINKAYGTYFVGCGTAGKVCLAASYLFSKVAKRHVNVAFGSEFPYSADFIKPRSLLIAISQSGETADTLEAMTVARKRGATIVAIVNNPTSTMAREADKRIHVKAGPEKAVASTKATTAQLAITMLIAYATIGELDEGRNILRNVSASINDMLNPRYEGHIRKLAERLTGFESMYVIGKGVNYPMALEAAIKLQEVSYIHAEGFAGGELKHGPIALISEGVPCIVLVANDETKDDVLANAMEVKARGGYIVGVSPQKEQVFDYWMRVPDVGEASPIVNIIPIQILAYHLAVLRQNDPDMPRNLAKSVTVK